MVGMHNTGHRGTFFCYLMTAGKQAGEAGGPLVLPVPVLHYGVTHTAIHFPAV